MHPIGDVVALVLISGTFLSYIPFYAAIASARHARGVSVLSILLLFASAAMTLLASVSGQWPLVVGALNADAFTAIEMLMPVLQLVPGPLCALWLYAFLFVYAERRAWIAVGGVAALLFCVLASAGVGTAIWMWGAGSAGNLTATSMCGALASVIVVVVWLPQIIMTARTGTLGALSVPGVAVQAFGSLLVFVLQAVLYQAPWGVWVPYAITAVEMGLILVMPIVHWIATRAAQAWRVWRQPVRTVENELDL